MKKNDIIFGLSIALFLAVFVSPFASPWLDGLEKVAQNKGFLEKADVEPLFTAPLPDYVWPKLKSEKLATSFAGACGTLIVFGAAYAVALLVRKNAQ